MEAVCCSSLETARFSIAMLAGVIQVGRGLMWSFNYSVDCHLSRAGVVWWRVGLDGKMAEVSLVGWPWQDTGYGRWQFVWYSLLAGKQILASYHHQFTSMSLSRNPAGISSSQRVPKLPISVGRFIIRGLLILTDADYNKGKYMVGLKMYVNTW